jgi:hypothetical protein
MSTRIVLPLGVAALIALGFLWFFSSFERVPVKEWVGPSGEARLRPFLAAGRFAQRMGLRTKELRSLPELDALPAGGVLLLPLGRQELDARRLRQILAWVERGGHLIAEAEYQALADPLFDQLGVRRVPAKRISRDLKFQADGGRTLQLSLPDGMALQPAAPQLRLRIANGEEIKVAAFERGKGMVSVASSLALARNHFIGQHDNAELLWQLVQLTPAAELQVYFQPQRLSLWRFLAEHAAELLVATAALLALWLWRIAPRFGPVAPDQPPSRRRMLDHLRASGRYFWAMGLRARLVGAARDAALRRIARSQPDFGTASTAEQIARLAAIADLSAEEAARLLAAAGPMRGAAFIQVVRDAQRVHSALEKGKR